MKTKIAVALMIVTAGSALIGGSPANAEEKVELVFRHHRDMPPPHEWREPPHHGGPGGRPPHEWREPPHHRGPGGRPPHEWREPPHRGGPGGDMPPPPHGEPRGHMPPPERGVPPRH